MAYPVYTTGPNGGGDYGMNGNPMSQQDPYSQLFNSIAPFIGGVGALATSGLNESTGREAAGMADPFSGERGQYQTGLRQYMGANPVNPALTTSGSNTALGMLSQLLQQPQMLTNMPGYRFGLNQAMEGVNRGAGASGLLNSGNRLAALEDRGNSYAQGWQNQIFNQLLGNVQANNSVAQLGLNAQGQGYSQLAHLAGADTGSPATAADALLRGRQNQLNSVGQGIGGIANGIGGAIGAISRIPGIGGGFNLPANPVTMGPPGDLFGPDPSQIVGPPGDLFGGGDFSGFDIGDIFGVGL